MKEKPILFNTEMVKAILDGRKTQSRRPVKAIKEATGYKLIKGETPVKYPITNMFHNKGDLYYSVESGNMKGHIKCPFGQIGDHLYVRETFRPYSCFQGSYRGNGIEYKSDGFKHEYVGEMKYGFDQVKSKKWLPSIHMPKKYARIWLEITNIRVEKIQGITEEQAKSEGITTDHVLEAVYKLKNPLPDSPFVGGFAQLWNSIYNNWPDNPWVWVIEFKRIDK